jgi:hypothetical protein
MPELASVRSVNPKDSIGASMYGDCPECKRLSENLSEATKSYFAILATIQLAINANNSALISELEAPKLAAQKKRAKARLELRHHEATHQDKAATA